MSPPTREEWVMNWRAGNLGKRPVLPPMPPNPLAAGKRTALLMAGGTEVWRALLPPLHPGPPCLGC